MFGLNRTSTSRAVAMTSALATALAGMVLWAPPAQAAIVFEAHGPINYRADNANQADGATVVSFTAGPTSVVIPDSVSIAGTVYAVKHIDNDIFKSMDLTSLTLGSEITTIGPNAFADNDLTSLTIPSSVKQIGDLAFESNELTSLTIPEGVTTVDWGAFRFNDLLSVTLPSSLSIIGSNVFTGNDIASVTLPNGVVEIQPDAFYDNNIASVSLPGSLTKIYAGAFSKNLLTSVTIPALVNEIQSHAFNENPSLTTVKFLGAAPTTIVDGGAGNESFDTNGGALLYYRPQFGPPTINGFTTPLWHGYTTEPYIAGLAPTISGTARETRTLTANTGPLDAGVTVTRQWKANGKSIPGATNPTIKLGKAQAGRRITVTMTASLTGAANVVRTSASTRIVNSPYRRLVLSTYSVKKGHTFIVTATGFKPHERVRIRLNNVTRYKGRADAYGVLNHSVTFKSSTKSGKRSVKVQRKSGSKYKTVISTTVRYYR